MAIKYIQGSGEEFAVVPASPIVDEEYWQNQVAPIGGWWRAPLFVEREHPPSWAYAKATQLSLEVFTQSAGNVQTTQVSLEVWTSPPAYDQDFWINPVGPVAASLYHSPVFVDPDEIPAGTLLLAPAVWEEYWQNPVSTVPASLYRSPARLDPEEIPAGFLFIPLPLHVQEDYWQQLVRPVAASLYQKLPLGDPEEIPASFLFLSYCNCTQLSLEVFVRYEKQVYTGWTGTSICVS